METRSYKSAIVIIQSKRLTIACYIHLVRRVSIGYTLKMTKKDAGMRIRIERELRDEFLAACQVLDRPAAQVIREFMRDFVRRNSASLDPHPATKPNVTTR